MRKKSIAQTPSAFIPFRAKAYLDDCIAGDGRLNFFTNFPFEANFLFPFSVDFRRLLFVTEPMVPGVMAEVQGLRVRIKIVIAFIVEHFVARRDL